MYVKHFFHTFNYILQFYNTEYTQGTDCAQT